MLQKMQSSHIVWMNLQSADIIGFYFAAIFLLFCTIDDQADAQRTLMQKCCASTSGCRPRPSAVIWSCLVFIMYAHCVRFSLANINRNKLIFVKAERLPLSVSECCVGMLLIGGLTKNERNLQQVFWFPKCISSIAEGQRRIPIPWLIHSVLGFSGRLLFLCEFRFID